MYYRDLLPTKIAVLLKGEFYHKNSGTRSNVALEWTAHPEAEFRDKVLFSLLPVAFSL